MILKNDYKVNGQWAMGNGQYRFAAFFSFCRLPIAGCRLFIVYGLLPVALLFSGCYTFKDIGSIPKEVKTFRVSYIENRSRYINPQLSPQMTDKLRQKIINQTRL